jgi:prepilin-type N-terminal cleavage/methylation domain-containing protein
MIKREAGFSLVELMITMVVFVFFIAAASQVFTGLLTQFKQQSKIAETNIEGIVGLEILRQDIQNAGYGLPWNLSAAGYTEIVSEPATPWIDRDFNDGPPDNPARGTDVAGASNPPGAFRSGNGYGLNGSDVLVIKAINVARNATCEKWTTLMASPFTSPFNPRKWTPALTPPQGEDLAPTDRVIVLRPGTTDANGRTLVLNGANFSTTFSGITSSPWPPTDPAETRLVYGVADSNVASLRMPFNRADFYVRRPATNMPQRCAPSNNIGILYKGTVNHADGLLTELPLLDCVADMRVDYWLDTDGDGDIDWSPTVAPFSPTDDISGLTARQIRDQVKEVRVYIVAHEGQRDVNYDFSMGGTKEFLSATEVLGTNSRTINFVNLKTQIGNLNYKYYRWKLYTIVVKPNNLR